MSNLSPVDQLRLALNMTVSAHLEPLRETLIEQSVNGISNLPEALQQLTRTDLEQISPKALTWARAQFMQHDGLPFETWSALLLHRPERARKAKPVTQSGFSAWAKAQDKTVQPQLTAEPVKSQSAWNSFLLIEKMFNSAPGNWLTSSTILKDTRDISKDMVAEILKQLPCDNLTTQERAQMCRVLVALPPLLFPTDVQDALWSAASLGWIGAITVYAQTSHHATVEEWERRSIQTALKKLDRAPEDSLSLLQQVLPNLVTKPHNLNVRAPNNPKVFSYYKNVLDVVDSHLTWNDADKLRFLPSGDDFLKIVRKRIVPNGNIAELVEDLFSFPMERMDNKDTIAKEFAHRFQVFMFFSVFANNKNDLDKIASAVDKIPESVLQAAQTTPAAAIDLKTVEAIIAPNSPKGGLKGVISKLLSSKKRKDERYVAVRQSIMQWLPTDLANSAQLLLHWADPEQYGKPNNGVTSLAVNKRPKEFDSADVAELRSLFLKQNLVHELGDQEDTVVRVARKI